jgi:hypothetical protein
MMNQTVKKLSLLAAALVCTVLLVPGCTTGSGTGSSNITGSSAPAASGSAAKASPVASAQVQASAKASVASTAPASPVSQFAADFKTVDKNPLNETVQYVLWLAANDPNAANTAAPGGTTSELGKLIDKYAALVAGTGVHYKESSNLIGMETINEVWMKAGKFKVSTEIMGLVSVVLFDGENYVKYDVGEKKGTRFTKQDAAADITSQLNGRVPASSASAYQQQKDQKVGSYNCSVFFMDIEVMGMKGNTLFVDKDTGLLVEYLVGSAKDKKNSMTITVTKFTKGGFGDDVFTVPAGITIEDYKP